MLDAMGISGYDATSDQLRFRNLIERSGFFEDYLAKISDITDGYVAEGKAMYISYDVFV